MISMIIKSRTHTRDLHEILLDLAMVKNGLLQTLIEKNKVLNAILLLNSNIQISSKYSYVESVLG